MSWAGPFLTSYYPFACGGLDPHLISGSYLIGSAAFIGEMIVTDRARNSVCSTRPHLLSAAMWPDNYNLAAQLLYGRPA